MGKLNWKWKDPSHFEAHRNEFCRPVEGILDELEKLLEKEEPGGEELFCRDFSLSTQTGYSALIELEMDDTTSFWAYRPARDIPSHVIVGKKEPTNKVCLWGWWEDSTFLIHTLYPGAIAPREIHDKDLKLSEIPEAIRFWTCHAIVIDEGAFSLTPYSFDKS
jgi:hypothetical protein